MIEKCLCFCFQQKTAYDVRISDWSSDVCSSDLRIEEAMGGLRAAIDDGTPADVVERQAQVIGSLLTDAEAALPPDRASAASAFLGAFTILLREGLEALLIVVAKIGRASCRERVCQYV